MITKFNPWSALVFGSFFLFANAKADIIEREFSQKSTGKVTSGTVLQGSKNMRSLGKRKSSRSSMRVLSPVQAVPGFSVTPPVSQARPSPEPSTAPVPPKSRFGYGAEKPSDGRTPVPAPRARIPSPPQPSVNAQPQTIYQFHYSYPVHRDYYYGTPFYGFSPFSPFSSFAPNCSNYGYHSGHRHYSSHGSLHGSFLRSGLSLFFGW